MGKIDVEFYDLPNGDEPVREFLDGLEPKMKAKMLRTIQLLADNGTELREPVSKPLGDGIFELRAQVGNNITRALYFPLQATRRFLHTGLLRKRKRLLQEKLKKRNATEKSTWKGGE